MERNEVLDIFKLKMLQIITILNKLSIKKSICQEIH